MKTQAIYERTSRLFLVRNRTMSVIILPGIVWGELIPSRHRRQPAEGAVSASVKLMLPGRGHAPAPWDEKPGCHARIAERTAGSGFDDRTNCGNLRIGYVLHGKNSPKTAIGATLERLISSRETRHTKILPARSIRRSSAAITAKEFCGSRRAGIRR